MIPDATFGREGKIEDYQTTSVDVRRNLKMERTENIGFDKSLNMDSSANGTIFAH